MNDELTHWGIKRGGKVPGSKYVARIMLKKADKDGNPVYRYFYSQQTYNSYLKSNQNKNISNNKSISILNRLSKAAKNISEKVNKATELTKNSNKIISGLNDKKISKEIEKSKKILSDVSKITDKLADDKSIKKTIKLLDKAKKQTVETSKTISDFISAGKKTVDKLISSKTGRMQVKGVVGDTLKTAAAIGGIVTKGVVGVLGSLILPNLRRDKTDQNADDKNTKRSTVLRDLADLSNLKKKSGNYTNDEDMTLINPNYEKGTVDGLSYDNNCSYCTLAYELRQRGFDVDAMGIDLNDSGALDEIAISYDASQYAWYDSSTWKVDRNSIKLLDWYSDPDPQYYDNIAESDKTYKQASKSIKETMESYGDGARGQMLLVWTGGGAHSVNWSVENGKAYIRDCQTNQKLEVDDYVAIANNVVFWRTDDQDLTDAIFDYEHVKNR